MRRVLVKIEGLRDAATAAEVARLGADAVGLVFAPSPRRVSADQARQVVAALPPGVPAIGVFVNAAADEINRIIEETGIGIVQLHGDEPPDMVSRVLAPCIKAFRVKDAGWAREVGGWLKLAGGGRGRRGAAHAAPAISPLLPAFLPARVTVLLDAYDPAVRGGSGKRFNWDLIARSRETGGGERSLDSAPSGEAALPDVGHAILAGGLDAACVAEAVRKVRPWAVDVASGVESAPGVKDLAKVKAFIEAVRSA
jgi:phosphoribosylanthranilate isomerase